MVKASVWAAAAIGLATLAGCAGTDADDPNSAEAAERPAPRCFSAGSARNFRVVDSRTVNVRVGRNVYRLDMFSPCTGLGFSSSSLRLRTSSGSQVCTGRGLGTSVEFRGSGGPQRCAVQNVTALTRAEVDALDRRFRP